MCFHHDSPPMPFLAGGSLYSLLEKYTFQDIAYCPIGKWKDAILIVQYCIEEFCKDVQIITKNGKTSIMVVNLYKISVQKISEYLICVKLVFK